MKRTPLTRKTPLKAKTGLKRSGPIKPMATKAGAGLKRSGPIKPMATPKPAAKAPKRRGVGKERARWRSEKHLKWVRALPCSLCGCVPAGQAHHIIGVGNMSGMAIKAPDWATLPVCPICHDQVHATPALWPRQWGWIERTMRRALKEGALVWERLPQQAQDICAVRVLP